VDHDQPHHPAHQDGSYDHAAADQQDALVKVIDAVLRLSKRRAYRDGRHSRGEGPDAVLDAVDRGVGVAIVELRQHDFAWNGDGGRPDPGGAYQTSVRGRLIDGGVLGSPQENTDVTQTAH